MVVPSRATHSLTSAGCVDLPDRSARRGGGIPDLPMRCAGTPRGDLECGSPDRAKSFVRLVLRLRAAALPWSPVVR